MNVPMELSRIVIMENSPQQFIFLKEKNGPRSFPIVIGIHEAYAIHRRLNGVEMPRPLTHDLLARVIDALGGRLDHILINDLRDHAFIATLVIEREGEHIEVDARPSDAIALGVAFDTPIFVAEHVLEEVVRDMTDPAVQRDHLKSRRDELTEEIARLQEELDDPGLHDDPETLNTLRRRLGELQAELEAIEEILRHLG